MKGLEGRGGVAGVGGSDADLSFSPACHRRIATPRLSARCLGRGGHTPKPSHTQRRGSGACLLDAELVQCGWCGRPTCRLFRFGHLTAPGSPRPAPPGVRRRVGEGGHLGGPLRVCRHDDRVGVGAPSVGDAGSRTRSACACSRVPHLHEPRTTSNPLLWAVPRSWLCGVASLRGRRRVASVQSSGLGRAAAGQKRGVCVACVAE
mmetsp:Transcript_12447/g.37348  ORF Transcript_12447/g.37348 Transcript_12447/m.37348 type:complete len:205 (-) Transcript_12447:576-1190(-)